MTRPDITIPASNVQPDPVTALITAYHADLLALELAYTDACQQRTAQFYRDITSFQVYFHAVSGEKVDLSDMVYLGDNGRAYPMKQKASNGNQ